MAKKIKAIRLDDKMIEFLTKVSFKQGYTHNLSDKLPNISLTIIKIISQYEILEEIGVNLSIIDDDALLSEIAKTVANCKKQLK